MELAQAQARASQASSKNASTPEVKYECEVCKDECIVIDFERNVAVPCQCVKRKRINKVLKHSRISDEFRAKTFDVFDVSDKDRRVVRAFQLAKGYAAKFDEVRKSSKPGFGIVGAVGMGKTHLLCAIANELLSRGVGVRYFNFVTGFKEMFAKYDEGGQAVEEIRWELQTCDVLMIDDLAKGKFDRKTGGIDIKKSVYDEIYGILDYRYFNGLPVIWSSELYAKLADDNVLGEAIATRLFEKSHMANVTYTKGEQVGLLNYRLKDFKG